MTVRRGNVLETDPGKVCSRLVDGAYIAWYAAQIECELAFSAWRTAGAGLRATAHAAYCAALDREEAAALDLQELCVLPTHA